MLRRRMVLALATAGMVGVCWLAQAICQDAPARKGRRDGTGDSSRMAEFRQRMEQRMREQLGATEEEWKVLQPRIDKVRQLMRQTRGGFSAFGGRGRRPGGAQPAATPAREQSDVEKKTEALRSLLADKASTPDAVKAALEALRKAREKAEEDLAVARKELQEIVTVRQEAALVLTGVLQ